LEHSLRRAPPTCARFLFASESCLPVAHPNTARERLFASASASEGQSWLRARNRPNNGYSGQLQFDPISVAVPEAARWKSDQWVGLTRAHAEAITRLPRALGVDVAGLLRRTRAPDELYYPTCLALLGELPMADEAIDLGACEGAAAARLAPQVSGRRLTFCDWSGPSAKSPALLAWGEEAVAAAEAEGCLMARKFAEGSVPVAAWRALVLIGEPGGGASDEEGEGPRGSPGDERGPARPAHEEGSDEGHERSRDQRKRSRSPSRSR
jgi:hypothetical protein